MRRIIILLCILAIIVLPVSAEEYTAPTAPEGAQELMSTESVSFGEDLWKIFSAAVRKLQPDFAEAVRLCAALVAASLLIAALQAAPGISGKVVELAGILTVAILLLNTTGTMINLGKQTITEIGEYEKLLLPVMTAAMAAQGGITASGTLYTGTAIFDALLSSVISKILVPLIYFYLAAAVAAGATGETMLKKIQDFLKWLVTWSLKTILYIFTGYMGITGVVSGTVDSATLKATKLTMSGMVPVVGGILSDASEAVIVSAGVMKNAVGVYGILAVIAICILPFLRIGIQYLLLKLTAVLCEALGTKGISGFVQSVSTAMGLLLGMTGAMCIFTLISTVCFMKGTA